MRALQNLFVYAMALFAAFALAVQPVAAQSVLRDAETEELLNDMAAPCYRGIRT